MPETEDDIDQAVPAAGTPGAEIDIDAGLVRALLAVQHPDLVELPLVRVSSGWDNATFRLGERLAVRMPRRALSAPLIAHEQRWLPDLSRRLPLPVPAHLRAGEPGEGYPWRWSVVPWLPGESADLAEPPPQEAAVLGGFLRALHRVAPADAPRNPYRGVPLSERAAVVEARIQRIGRADAMPEGPLRAVWQRAARAPSDGDSVWIHGDLHSRNVLVEAGRISAVIDWGDMAAGDRATDLAATWMLFGEHAHGALRDAYGPADGAVWERARGWALLFGVMLLDTGLHDDARFELAGRRTLERLLS